MKLPEKKSLIKHDKAWVEEVVLDLADGDHLEWEFEGGNCYTKYQRFENDDVIVEQSTNTIHGIKFNVKEIKMKKTNKKTSKVEFE